jgi:hypothetical protein
MEHTELFYGYYSHDNIQVRIHAYIITKNV